MSHTINMLAKRNIQKYKKHYLIVLIVLLIVSTFIFSSFFIVDNLYQMKRIIIFQPMVLGIHE